MFVNFFIDRPIFSAVIAIVITLAGAICIPILPVAQFPSIAPPVVQINTTYTGASAEVVEQSVTTPIEQQVNGVQGMSYMNSISGNDGTSTINVTFDVGYDMDIAAVDVQNYQSFAAPQLPEDVKRYGVTTKKQATAFILVVNLFSDNPNYDGIFLSNYASINIVDVLKRIPGVGNVTIFGERKYSLRIWLDPDKMASMGISSSDVVNAVRSQNIQVAAGSIATPPITKEYPFQYTIMTKGRLENVEEFENIVVSALDSGEVVRIKDVAKVEMGAENYYLYSKLNQKGTASIGVFQLPGANSIDIANKTKQIVEDISKRFPEGVKYKISYDTTMFVRESIAEVIETLLIAILLVFAVIYVFLQSWRSTIIPAITIPVSLVGTFAVMAAFGYSINTLTLFGLVLAIGLVVDDAIVVLENVERIVSTEHGIDIKEATKKSMKEVVAPIIATTLVLMAVFVPVSMMPGISGAMYRQFAMTIAISVGISAINALTLSPALCAIFLKEGGERKSVLFSKFNDKFAKFSKWTEDLTAYLISHHKKVMIAFLCMMVFVVFLFTKVPTGFIPDEDQGYFYALLQGPEGSSIERTARVTSEVEDAIKNINGIQDVLTIGGYNLIQSNVDSSFSSLILILKPWSERSKSESAKEILKQVYLKTRNIKEMSVFPFMPPPIQGLSSAGGFQFMLEDLIGGDINKLDSLAKQMISEASKRPELARVMTSFKTNYPQFYIDLDRTKAMTLGVRISDVFATVQANLGSMYVNDFNKYGKIYRVFVQAKEESRTKITDIPKLYVKSKNNQMVPLSSLVQVKEVKGVQTIAHYNLYRAIEIDGSAAPGYSSGQAIKAMEEIADNILPEGYSYDWTGVAFQEKKAGSLAVLVFALAIVFVFLFLAAQYESFSMPLMIMLAVPLAIMGALSFQWLRGLTNDIYCQIGLVTLIGLASKNAILIVEFAKNKRHEGMEIVESALTAIRIRLRPILMTALAFVLGVLPLVFASGAGAASRHSLGTAVFGGMVVSTFLSIGIVPVLYVIIEKMREKKKAD